MRRASAMGIFSVIMLILAGAAFVLMVLRPAILGTGAASGGDGTPAPSVDTSVFETRIAFVSERDGNTEIYTMKPDGSDVIRLTHNDGYDLSPQWSPDGSRIAWLSEMDGQRDLYVMNADGSGVIRLTNTPEIEVALYWSPNSMEIAYTTTSASGNLDLMGINVGGGEPRLIYQNAMGNVTWSPDGAEIALTTNVTVPDEAAVINAASGEIVRYFENVGVSHLAWHPQESKIAFAIRPAGSLWAGLWVMDSAQLSETASLVKDVNVIATAWSRYGNFLAYYAWRDGAELPSADLYVLDMINNAAPLHVARIIEPMGFDWSPDEAQIAYASKYENGEYHIHVVRRDQAFVEGYEHEILTRGMQPDWSPYLGPFPQPTPTSTPTPLVPPTVELTATLAPTLTLDPLATGYSETATAQAQALLTPTLIPTLDPALPTPTSTQQPAAIVTPPAPELTGDALVEIVNFNSAYCGLYIVPSDSDPDNWGVNWLAAGQVGQSYRVLIVKSVAPGVYDLKVEDCLPERNITSYQIGVEWVSGQNAAYVIGVPSVVLAVDNQWADICKLYVVKSFPINDNWGRNLLTAGAPIPDGTIWRVALLPGSWNTRAEDCGDEWGNVYFAERMDYEIEIGELLWVLTPE